MIHVLLFLQLLGYAQTEANQSTSGFATLMQSGTDAESRGDLRQAIDDFNKAVDLEPDSATAALKLGDAYMRKGDYAAAIPPLRRAVTLDGDSVPSHQFLGYALLSQGYASEAIPHLLIAHESGALGIAYLETDQPAEAVSNLAEALKSTPNDPDLIYYLARAGATLSSASRERLLSDFAQTARGHQMLGQNYYAEKMYSEAEKEYADAITLTPNLPGLHLELGEIYAARSQWAQAQEQFRVEAKLEPGNPEGAYRLGDALLQQGKMEEAAEDLRRSDSLRPDMPETLYALGRALAVSDPDRAERALDRVIALEKQTSLAGQAYLLLAGIHRKQGQTQAAANDIQEYKRIQALAAMSSKR
jgi:tetratricopeptide (TPR) repeat protein